MVELKDKADGRAAQLGQPGVVERLGRLAGNFQRARRGPLQQADDVQQRAFARPRRPPQRDKLGLLQGNRNAVQHLGFHLGADVVAAADVGEAEDGRWWDGHCQGFSGDGGA